MGVIFFVCGFCMYDIDVEWWLASKGVVETAMEEDPRLRRTTITRAHGKGMHSATYDSDEEL